MGLAEKMVLSLVKWKMEHPLGLDEIKEIPSDGIREHRNVPYTNRSGKELKMDIFEPVVAPGTELPVIINIHGGALIMGNKDYSVGFCRQLAHRGYLVFSLEYRLIPDVRVYEQFDDVCAGIDCVGRKLVDFDVDLTRIYLAAESAGAYLATYVAAMKKSKALQEAIGYPPSRINFRAISLISGMIYTTRKDATGRFLSKSFYGMDEKSKQMGPVHQS